MVQPPTPAPAVPLDAVREELARILASPDFAGAERLRRFLRFIVETAICGRGAELKEYLIGCEVFDGGEGFDPRQNAVVRVQAHSLRARLQRYYESGGRDDPVLIELPKGRYTPVFALRQPPPRKRSRLLTLPAALLVVVAAAAALLWWALATHTDERSAIVVLPFLNLSSDPENQYFTDGLVEELTAALTRIGSLRVAGRVSAGQFNPRGADLKTVRRKLGVGWVLEGSVRKAGGRLRVTAQLIRTSDGYHSWSEVYESDLSDVFRVQDRIVRSIAGALELRLAHRSPPPAPSANVEAHDSYLRGRFFRKQMTPEGLAKSAALFENAARKDPGFAPAFAALADSYAMLAFHGLAPFDATVPKARQAARAALALDSSSPQAHGALAWIAFSCDRDWAAAEPEFRRAIELDPNWPSVRQWFAFGLVSQQRFDEAVAQSLRATELDPLSFLTTADLSTVLYFARRYRQSIGVSRRALELNPNALQAHLVLGSCLSALNRPADALAELRRSLDPASPETAGRLGHACARAGRPEEAARLLDQLSREGTHRFEAALIEIGLGHHSRAFELLNQACDRREGSVLFLKVEPLLDPLRPDPRFSLLLKRVWL